MTECPIISHPLRITEVPAQGRKLVIEADADARAALARSLDIPSVNAFRAEFSINVDASDRVVVQGRIQADVTRTCVVTLDEISEKIDEAVATEFVPESGTGHDEQDAEIVVDPEMGDVEVYTDGMIDLGVLATEHLALGLDPYPRKADAAFAGREEMSDAEASPFAALAALRSSERKDG